ncbi:flagellar hook assembly protein FlgD [Alkalicoccus daliensis]|uniref:Flagellar basal-body rod modification protein FlgD n=1 Tax=Alkalicoccus daliensis TaxID=745820 RepID=A0A1H0A5B6_9BACI|nr:flagellar hook assembly protein FlgD [Alkalicoccus daliensis]SDN28163.1 flagellar basal-body rod modification protein FlgD [Alkalicoccus daliensis]
MPIQSNLGPSQPIFYEDYVQQKKNKAPGSDLDKDAFLKILLTQLQHQDPMNPMEDKEFIAQMAQFSSLEQITNLNETMKKMFEQQQKSDFVSHSDLIGKKVEYEHVAKEATETEPAQTELREGIVTSVVFHEGKAQFIIDGDARIKSDKLFSVSEGS